MVRLKGAGHFHPMIHLIGFEIGYRFQFKLLTGMGFVSWVLVERLAYAQRLLESTSGSIEVVAGRTGFGSPESLRLHFRRQFGIAPSEWRKQFRG